MTFTFSNLSFAGSYYGKSTNGGWQKVKTGKNGKIKKVKTVSSKKAKKLDKQTSSMTSNQGEDDLDSDLPR